jgi:homoserine kinase type II
MAVFTHLAPQEIMGIIAEADVGDLLAYEGITEGIDNTNYKLVTSTGNYILTIFESRIDPNDLPYFIGFMEHLSNHNIICPKPIIVSHIHQKPAALFSFLEGHNVDPKNITTDMCRELGSYLANLHIIGQDFQPKRKNSMDIAAWESRLLKVGEPAKRYLKDIDTLKKNWPKNLPIGTIHADLFPDNVFVKDDHIYGVIDFYFSATDFLAYDLAIVMNAWCFDTEYQFVRERWTSLLAGYESVRPLTQTEKDFFQILAIGAAMRFLSSRLYDLTFHDVTALVTPKLPTEYILKLEFHCHENLF